MPNQRINEEGSSSSSNGGFASRNLWIGNLPIDTTDEELMNHLEKYGPIDSLTTYSARCFAFVYFKSLEDARTVREALQGSYMRGNPIRIDFARPAKPGKQLWVGGISPSVAKEQLEDEFLKFGKIEDFKFLKDRNSALVTYYSLEDASEAVKNLNGKCLDGEHIRVDFLRSQPSRRENWSDVHDAKDERFSNRRSMGPADTFSTPADATRSSEMSQSGNKRPLSSQNLGGRNEGQPNKVLWVGYPPSVPIDEQMLHNAMILFGEIERIKSFPSKNYSFVEFRSPDEARRAKEGLQGRLFNDRRIHIMYSSSGLAPPKDSPGFFMGNKGPTPNMFFHEQTFGPVPMDFIGHNHPMGPNNFPPPLPPKGFAGPFMLPRPFGPQGGFDPHLAGPEMYKELAGVHNNFSEANTNNPMSQTWRRPSAPALGMLPASALGVPPPIIPMPNTWDRSDPEPFLRESKRSRIHGPPIDNASFPARRGPQGTGGDLPYGHELQLGRGAPGMQAQGQRSQSPVGVKVGSWGPPGMCLQDSDYCWRGTIAKGGTPVCHARCVSIGKGIDSQLPEFVNCSARTGLDMLAKHYAEASGFDIVFFLPDSEEDFASYTEFLRYLGEKNRAGVVKFDDGTTLFLVPPSNFLTSVLKVSGPERLYGVVLKLPSQIPNASLPQLPQPQLPLPVHPSQYIERQQLPPSQTGHGILPQNDHALQMDYNQVLHAGSLPHPTNPLLQPANESHPLPPVPQDYASNPSLMPNPGVSLTPELFATLSTLLPGTPSLLSSNAQQPLGSATSSQWVRQDHQANFSSTPHNSREEQAIDFSQQSGHQFNAHAPLSSHFPGYMEVMNGPGNSSQVILSSSQVHQDPAPNVPQQGISSSGPSTNFFIPPQGEQFSVPQQAKQQFQVAASPNPERSHGTGNDSSGYQSSIIQKPKTPFTPDLAQGVNLSQTQFGTPSVNDNVNTSFPNQVQQAQSTPPVMGQGLADTEVDRSERYQSTLQFAASLLLQIQQQQQGSTQASQGSGNN